MSHFDTSSHDSTRMLLDPAEGAHARDAPGRGVPPARSELLPQTRTALEQFARRRARLQRLRGISLALLTLALGMLGLTLVDYFIRMSTPVRIASTLTVYASALAVEWFYGIKPARQRDWIAIARSMEMATPPLRERLLSAVELEDPRVANGSLQFRSTLQSGVAGQLSSVEIGRMLPWRLIRRPLLAVAAVVVTISLLSLVPGLQMTRRLGRVFVPIAPIERASITRLSITAPSPPSRSVAEGDLVAVVAAVSHLRGGEVTLQWQSDDGRQGSQPLAHRDFDPAATTSRAAAGDGSTAGAARTPHDDSSLFSVNIPVDTTPVHYRVLANDAETLWHTLTPMPRPRIVSFEKRYHFPAYAKLPDAVTEEEFGDLEALVGTNADVTVKFDQAVHSADVWFGDSRSSAASVPMQQVGDDPAQFRFRVAIKTPGSYRVDAVSRQSELNNPFLPRFVIDPVFDRAPLATWTAAVPARQIASPVAILKLTGTVADDLPMDRFLVQYSLDDESLQERVLTLSPSVVEQSVEFDWDLMDLTGEGTRSQALPPGARLRIRLVAIDRANQRGESDWIDIYVGGEGFDPDRHDDLFALQAFTARLNTWWDEATLVFQEIKKASQEASKSVDPNLDPPDSSLRNQLDELTAQWSKLAGSFDAAALREQKMAQLRNQRATEPPLSLERLIFENNDAAAADRWSMLDRFVTSSLGELRDGLTRWQLAAELGEPLSTAGREVALRDVLESVTRWEGPAKLSSDLAPLFLATELAVALQRDMNAVRQSADLLAAEDSAIPIERLPGEADLLAERMRQIDSLIVTVQPQLPAETLGHLQNFRRFVNQSANRIDQVREKLQQDRNPNVESEFHQSMAKLRSDMQQYQLGSLMHGNTFNRIAHAIKELGRDQQQSRAKIAALVRAGREYNTMIERSKQAQSKQDSAQIAAATALQELYQSRFNDSRSELSKSYQRSAARELTRADWQVKTASDFKLVRRVVEHIAEQGYAPVKEESPDQAFDRIERAATVLEAGGQTIRLANEVQDLVDRERFGTDRVDRALGQNLRLEHYQVTAETPLNQLRATKIDQAVFDHLNASRWDEDFSQARQWISRRLYEPEPLVSAAAPLQSIVARYQAADASLTAMMNRARATLRAFLPSTSELAQAAAQEARKQADPAAEDSAEENTSPADRDGEAPATPDEETRAVTPQQQLEQLQEKVDKVAENLVARADGADLSDPAERELARDADAALAQIQERMEAVAAPVRAADIAAKTSPESPVTPSAADASEQLRQLAETLETTAEHFAAADAGQDLSKTRQELRADAAMDTADAALPDSLDAALQDAMAAQAVAQATPQELLKRLEKQLQRDQPMQEDLADISKQTVNDAQTLVQEVAKQEKRLQRELEKADPNLSEQKRVLRDQLKSLADQARAINEQWLATAQSASARNKNDEAQAALRKMRQDIVEAAEATESTQNNEALLQEIQSAAQNLETVLAAAAQQTKEIQQQAEQASEKETIENEKARQQLAKQLESEQRRVQNEWIKSLERQTQAWKRRRDEASRRLQQAENQKRDAEKKLKLAEQQLKKNPDQDWAQRGEQQSKQRVAEAALTVQAAKQTQQSAEQAGQQAGRQTDQAKQQSVDKLEALDPVAQLLARASQTSHREMERLTAELDQVHQRSDSADAPTPPAASRQKLASEQKQASQTVRNAAESLFRAARHEQRLGKSEAAKELSRVAENLESIADSPMQHAQRNLDQVARAADPSSPTIGKETGEKLAQAAEQLASSAESLAALGGTMAAGSASEPGELPPAAPESSGTRAETDKSEKLARALDELDQALHMPPPTEAAQEQTAEFAAQRGDGEAAAEQNGETQNSAGQNADAAKSQDPSAGGKGQQQATAGKASPTLAGEAEQAIRRLAAQRQQRLNEIASAGQPQAPSSGSQPSSGQSQDSGAAESPQSDQAGAPGTQSGESSHMPDGGLLSLDKSGRVGGEWGQLRERKSGDTIQDRKTRLPLEYRPAIEAYFQAIAAEAARGGAGGAAEDSR